MEPESEQLKFAHLVVDVVQRLSKTQGGIMDAVVRLTEKLAELDQRLLKIEGHNGKD